MMEEEMLEKKVWAVIGVNDNPEKYGNMIYKKLKSHGYTVYPVNPNYEEIEGDKCYKDLSSLPEVPEVIDMVVSPKRGIEVIEEAAKVGVSNIWFQPGTYNNSIMDLIDEKGLNAVQACVLVALR
ncbi:CoA-binding protein [Acetivibrio cellulolyticus]|uniref:CoA-binding protein n=1 Tax=Acetivibrio cellulolyticus TaxID=35830 RepID=UPI0001E2D929|nr:CoA-binding protein [Acetivibrio cellulolyticus]